MDPTIVATYLERAASGSRALDAAIAKAIGWRHASRPGVEDNTNEPHIWFPPNSSQPTQLPYFTTNLQDSFQLAEKTSTTHFGGFSWEPGKGSARISSNGSYYQGSSPQIAICIAVMYALVSATDDEDPIEDE